MPLIERLIGTEEPKLSVHAIAATLRLMQSGLVTKAQALDRWPELTGQDLSDIGDILDMIAASTLTWDDFEAATILGESGKMTATEIRGILGL